LLDTDNFSVIIYYCPPHYTLADEQFLDLSLCRFLSLVSNASSQVILMCDLTYKNNADWIHNLAPAKPFYDTFMSFVNESGLLDFVLKPTRMWATAQRDGRSAEYRWRPLFNAAKCG